MKTIPIWCLCEGDIEDSCKRMGIPFCELTEAHKRDIAYRFGKALEFSCENWWEEGLQETIREVIGNE